MESWVWIESRVGKFFITSLNTCTAHSAKPLLPEWHGDVLTRLIPLLLRNDSNSVATFTLKMSFIVSYQSLSYIGNPCVANIDQICSMVWIMVARRHGWDPFQFKSLWVDIDHDEKGIASYFSRNGPAKSVCNHSHVLPCVSMSSLVSIVLYLVIYFSLSTVHISCVLWLLCVDQLFSLCFENTRNTAWACRQTYQINTSLYYNYREHTVLQIHRKLHTLLNTNKLQHYSSPSALIPNAMYYS